MDYKILPCVQNYDYFLDYINACKNWCKKIFEVKLFWQIMKNIRRILKNRATAKFCDL